MTRLGFQDRSTLPKVQVKTRTQFDPDSDEIPEAAKQEKIRDVYNQLETNSIRILQTGKTDPILKYCVSAARQAILLELEHRHPYLHYDKPVAAAVRPSLDGFEYRFYTKNYKDNDALVAYIVDRRKNPARSSYSTMLVDMVVAEMRPVTPPAVSGPAMTGITAANDILDANGPYVVAVVAAYDEAVKTTDGKTETQLGLAADHVSYR
ncbi:hypothetical protein LA080_014599 [Diaporthe eres]|nr:hypothetical protein LA080_014599 [Diaporthe eres]